MKYYFLGDSKIFSAIWIIIIGFEYKIRSFFIWNSVKKIYIIITNTVIGRIFGQTMLCTLRGNRLCKYLEF